ncbi:biopolymer transporter ExbD [Psychrobium sp. 1_MG-2023]|uniref:ExbD/TolR family protein n=1 Tax=Psychrobium sp. 1_MG-2023 TaxID=3062624 RepID=UPI000C31CE45|nr:biopolymer transporter ExbD [Psychrobium sp. 1_MG-2023]MDP2559525.1 biopolymer transporter ExbD [Psychrobium sp. 1_MG-2023]PKF59365.1 biopolymer transporter ExbD [Alteromonadales bacterium alter-6D02]
MFRKSSRKREEPELDITSFMSLMIVLVPVLLMMMVFSHISILELKLPSGSGGASEQTEEVKRLELLVEEDALSLFYPQGVLLKTLPKKQGQHDYATLVQALKEVKFLLNEKGIEKKDINLLIAPDINYQTIVSVMDSVRSYQAVVAASVVDAELFPDISLSDAPVFTEAQ